MENEQIIKLLEDVKKGKKTVAEAASEIQEVIVKAQVSMVATG